MATKIVTKNSSTASAVPTASDLVQGELAVNVADKRLFTEDNAGAIVELGTNPTTLNVNGTATMDGLTVSKTADGVAASIGKSGGTNLNIYTDTNTVYLAGSAALSNAYIIDETNNTMQFKVNAAERMRISSAGHTTFGTINLTPADSAVNGTSILSDGRINHNAQSQPAAVIGRTGTDGTIVDLRKNGTTVGSIQSRAGLVTNIILDPRADGAGLTGTTNTIEPVDETGTRVDNTINLASSAYRFKDLYLSGGITNVTASGTATSTIISAIAGVTNGFEVSANASNQMTYDFNTGLGLKMRIDNAGNVGIGTSSPFFTTSGRVSLSLNGSNSSILAFGKNGSSENYILADAGGFTIANTSATLPTTFFNNGAERMRIDSAGSTIIRSGNKLILNRTDNAIGGEMNYVAGTGFIFNDANGDGVSFNQGASNKVRIDSAGRVGIGTSPVSELDVAGTIPTLTIKDTQNKSWTSADTTLGELAFRTSDTSGIGPHNVSFVRAVNEVASGSTPSGALSFGVAASNANASEAMRIDSSGNVGIGNSSPSTFNQRVNAPHLVVGAGSNAAGLTLYSGTSNQSSINFAVGTTTTQQYDGGITYHPSSYMGFHTNNGAERMRIDSSGNVGIGTSSPSTYGGKLNITDGAVGGESTLVIANNNANQFVRVGINNNVAQIAYDNADSLAFGEATDSTTSGLTTERMRIDSAGNLLVGTTGLNAQRGFAVQEGPATNVQIMHNFGQASGTSFVQFLYATSAIGSITQSGTTAVLYNTSSDQRLKENIADADDAGSKIDSIQVRKYDWKADGSHQDYGMIAQELQAVAPEAVSGDADSEEMMGVDYSKLVPMLIKEIQSLRNRVAQLEE